MDGQIARRCITLSSELAGWMQQGLSAGPEKLVYIFLRCFSDEIISAYAQLG
jgi:hypothetical protein